MAIRTITQLHRCCQNQGGYERLARLGQSPCVHEYASALELKVHNACQSIAAGVPPFANIPSPA